MAGGLNLYGFANGDPVNKTSHRMALDPSSGALRVSNLDVGRTFGFKGYGDVSLTMEGSMQDGWDVTATAKGVGTAFNTLGLGPGNEIDFTASLHVSPSGEVTLTGGAWDGFPSIEIWIYPEEGKPYLLLETGETNLRDLRGSPDRKFP